MSFDLSSFSSYGAEAAPPASAPAEGQTLTLQLRLRHTAAPMGGTMAIRTAEAAPDSLRAAVVQADPAPLTITL